eukprot:TRINITY_DN43402_c0_g2_i1.p1 TRINITY_DN43402_c0_g2~~TRINITY_DN43402_c0_g2_i1.p1  ORF type:complete len:181 (-),score=35.81 TRINITY_DN43402_c0_g2_i1:276-818(-)
MLRSLVGSEMCIRDRHQNVAPDHSMSRVDEVRRLSHKLERAVQALDAARAEVLAQMREILAAGGAVLSPYTCEMLRGSVDRLTAIGSSFSEREHVCSQEDIAIAAIGVGSRQVEGVLPSSRPAPHHQSQPEPNEPSQVCSERGVRMAAMGVGSRQLEGVLPQRSPMVVGCSRKTWLGFGT